MEIHQIKSQLSIHKVLRHYNLIPNKNDMLSCPFHADKTPSMQIYPRSNTYCCYSSNCKAGTGDQIQFIELMENGGKPAPKEGRHEAILKAQSLLGANPQPIKTEKPKQMSAINYEAVFKSLSKNTTKQEALAYLEQRSLNHDKLEIGFNPFKSAYKELQNCIVFPLKDKEENMVSFYGRSVLNSQSGSDPSLTGGRHYYTANRKGLYPSYPDQGTKKLILTESIIDAATLLMINEEIMNNVSVLALYGTNGFTSEHSAAIKEWTSSGVEKEEIILWFDGDEAGKAAVIKYSEQLKKYSEQLSMSSVDMPEGDDINSLLQGHEPSILHHLLNSRKYISGKVKNREKITENSFSFSTETSTEKKEETKLNTHNPEYITFKTGSLKFTLLGGINLNHLDRLRVTLKLSIEPQLSSFQSTCTERSRSVRHNLDLYHDDQVEKFSRKAAEKLEIGTTQINESLSELTEALEQYRLEKQESKKEVKPQTRVLTQTQKEAAIKYLKAPNLLKRTNEDIGKTGVVGEETNRLLMYLCFTSRLRENPLHVISLGTSGTGKTYLQEKIAELIPESDKLEITILSDNAFYYFGQKELQNKLILIEDMDGAENVLYPLRELMSKKRISKTIPIKDSKGNLKTISLKVEGPICLAGTTTKENLYEDNANRSLLIYRDNSKKHQSAIMNYQRILSSGEINTQQEEQIKEMFKDIQTVLKPIKVRNPYAKDLIIPPEVFKPLRTNTHYLQFIECVTFYHQYQREVKHDSQSGSDYIETTLEDIAAANYLLKEVLLAKADELSGACRTFFEMLKAHVKKVGNQSFYSKELRDKMRMNPYNLKYYLQQLTSYGYVKVVGGNRYKQGLEYEIINKDEYQNLQNNITNALDMALEKVKEKTQIQRG